MFKLKNRAYTSEIDTFLHDFDQKNTKMTESVEAEVSKAKRVSDKRDDPSSTDLFEI